MVSDDAEKTSDASLTMGRLIRIIPLPLGLGIVGVIVFATHTFWYARVQYVDYRQAFRLRWDDVNSEFVAIHRPEHQVHAPHDHKDPIQVDNAVRMILDVSSSEEPPPSAPTATPTAVSYSSHVASVSWAELESVISAPATGEATDNESPASLPLTATATSPGTTRPALAVTDDHKTYSDVRHSNTTTEMSGDRAPGPEHRPTFSFAHDFCLPHPHVYLQPDVVMNATWMKPLQEYLASIHPARTVTLTVASRLFTSNLLNWLISAHIVADPPLEHVIVIAFDMSVHLLLKERRIMSIMVPYWSVLRNTNMNVEKIWMARFAIIRILNHWGYHVQQLDTDAIVLRNPQPLFDMYPQFDIVASRGSLPFGLGRGAWGFTVCMGVVLVRSSAATESLWNAMHSSRFQTTTDDQKRINYGLRKTKIVWDSKNATIFKEITGINQHGLKVVIIPAVYICRHHCNMNSTEYYVWHLSGAGHSPTHKIKQSVQSTKWFLHPDWRKRSEGDRSIVGMDWLSAIADMELVKQYHYE